MEVVLVIVALVAGLAIGFLLAKLKTSSALTQIAVLENRLRETESQTEQRLESERALASQRISQYEQRLAEEKESAQRLLDEQKSSSEEAMRKMEEAHERILNERRRAYEKNLEEKERAHQEAVVRMKEHNRDSLEALQGRFDETVAKMRAELEAITSEMLKRRQSEFETSSRENVSKILEPLNEDIRRMKEAVEKNTTRNSEFGGELTSHIKMVMEHSDAARESAEKLASALRGGTKVQGNWGETVLTELLESQGLKEGMHFETQASIRDEAGNLVKGDDGAAMRPDVILHLDNDRDVIIDAKVSLSAYLDYINAETDEKRDQSLNAHVRSVENHVNELAKKDYSSYSPKTRAMDYVIMFVPNTAALYAATSAKSDLWRKAMEKKVYIADEQTLYAALKIINMTWRQIAQAENHEKVYSLANEMLDRVSAFLDHFTKIGKQLDDARSSYDAALKKLEDKGQSIPQTSRKLIKLGAQVKSRKGVDSSWFAPDQDSEPRQIES